MNLMYNGVRARIMQVTDCQREAVYDDSKTDVLYIRWRLSCLIHVGVGGDPIGMAVDQIGETVSKDSRGVNERPDPIRGSGVLGQVGPTQHVDPPAYTEGTRTYASLTDQEMRLRLMLPRKKLLITAFHPDLGERIFLESPRYNSVDKVPTFDRTDAKDATKGRYRVNTDAANGPTPLRCDIIDPTGEGVSHQFHFMIETCLAPCDSDNERLILSHRWTVHHTHDEHNYLTQVTEGDVIFNGSIINASGLSPDYFRQQFFHPIPLGFERKIPELTLSPDGLTLHYVIQDTDSTVIFSPGDSGATEMGITEELNYLAPFDLAGMTPPGSFTDDVTGGDWRKALERVKSWNPF